MALEAFRKIQVGKETTSGTAVAADKRLVGGISMTPQYDYHRPSDERGSLAEFFRGVQTGQRTALRYEADATYQQIIDFLAMSVKGGVSGVQIGTSGAYTWTFTPSLTSLVKPDTYTFEYGDDDQAWECPFVFVENLELAFTLGGVLQLRADLMAQGASKATFTGSLSDATVNEIVSNKLKVAKGDTDSWSDFTIGSSIPQTGETELASLVLGGTIRLATGYQPAKYADGTLDFSDVVQVRRHLELQLDLVMGTNAVTEWDAYKADTRRALRLRWEGPDMGSGNNGYLDLGVVGKYTSAPQLFGSQDGQNVVSMTLSSEEDGSGNEFSLEVVADVDTI